MTRHSSLVSRAERLANLLACPSSHCQSRGPASILHFPPGRWPSHEGPFPGSTALIASLPLVFTFFHSSTTQHSFNPYNLQSNMQLCIMQPIHIIWQREFKLLRLKKYTSEPICIKKSMTETWSRSSILYIVKPT